MMSHFIQKILLFATIPIVFVALIDLSNREIFPAPRVTSSYCLNEKLFFLKNFDAKYITIGSSFAMNNISSDEMIKGLKTDSYINLASWGMKMPDNLCLLKVYFENYHPSVVYLASNIFDFDSVYQVKLKKDQIFFRISYPYSFLTFLYYIPNLDIRYYTKYYEENRKSKVNNRFMNSICFDKYGGMPYADSNFIIDSTLDCINHNNFKIIEETSYDYLDSVVRFVTSNKCKLVFIQSPTNPMFVDEDYKKEEIVHIERVRSIVAKYNQHFIDASTVDWPDSIFVDYGHFHRTGASLFTRYLLVN
jgi:hypothetical protein